MLFTSARTGGILNCQFVDFALQNNLRSSTESQRHCRSAEKLGSDDARIQGQQVSIYTKNKQALIR